MIGTTSLKNKTYEEIYKMKDIVWWRKNGKK